MKFIILTFTAIGLMSCSLLPGDKDIAESEVPSVVKNAFASKYADAKEVDWEMRDKDFEVDFEINNVDYALLINSSGEILMQKEEITKEDLPDAVTSGINANFSDLQLDEVEKIEKDGAVYYQVEFDSTFKDKEVVFAANGQEEKSFSYWD